MRTEGRRHHACPDRSRGGRGTRRRAARSPRSAIPPTSGDVVIPVEHHDDPAAGRGQRRCSTPGRRPCGWRKTIGSRRRRRRGRSRRPRSARGSGSRRRPAARSPSSSTSRRSPPTSRRPRRRSRGPPSRPQYLVARSGKIVGVVASSVGRKLDRKATVAAVVAELEARAAGGAAQPGPCPDDARRAEARHERGREEGARS